MLRKLAPLWLVLLAVSLSAFQRKTEDDDGFDQPLARWHYYYDERQSSATEFPEGARLRAFRSLDRAEKARLASKTNARAADFSLPWKSIGPRPINFRGGYVTSGRITALAVDPRSADTVYAGAADGGVWKTLNGGGLWTPITDDQPSLAIGSIALDPSSPDTVYVGTGEENFSQDAYSGVGILKSTNGGATWTNIVGPFARQRVGSLAVNPSNGNTLLAASNLGIYRSTDAGVTWTSVLVGTGTSVFFDPSQPTIAWAGLGAIRGDAANGVYRSADGGITWTLLTGGSGFTIPSGTNTGRIEMVSVPGASFSAYAVIANPIVNGASSLNGIYKTTDSGQHWNSLNAPDFCNPQCWYNLVLRQHPTSPQVLFAGGVQLYRSVDAGNSWSAVPSNGSVGNAPHVDHHALRFSSDGSRFYDGDDGGVFSTQNFTAFSAVAINWNNLNASLSITQYYPSISIHPADPTISLAGSQDNGTHLYQNNPEWTLVVSGDGGWTAIDPANPSIAYAEYVDVMLFKSSQLNFRDIIEADQGISQQDRVPFIASYVLDAAKPNRLYFGTYRIYKTEDAAGLWIPISPDLTDPPASNTTNSTYTISTIAVAPTDSKRIYTGARSGSVYTSPDGGATWNSVSAGLPVRSASHLTVDPVDPSTVYATYSGFASATETFQGHVFRSTDAGNTWTDLSGDLPNVPCNDLVLDPDLPNTLYLATDLGAMVSSNGGANWVTLGAGLPKVAVTSLTMHRPSRTLRAGTHGRGVFDYALPAVADNWPVILSLSPASKNAGDAAFTLTIAGSNFSSASKVRWNGEDRPVTSITPSSITLAISAADVKSVGRAAVTVVNLTSGGGSSLPANFVIGPAPVIQSNSAVNAASPTSNLVASPGSLVTLYGTNLTGSLVAATAFPLPETLGESSVMGSGGALPLYFVSPGQINFQVPYEFAPNIPISLLVVQGAFRSNPISLNVSRVSPGLFATNQQGTGQGAIRIAGLTTIAAPVGMFPDARPAAAGEVIEIYGTGLGAVTPGGLTGEAASSSPLQSTLLPATVTIGGLAGQVSFAGLAPGVAGLYQVDVTIPNGVSPGNSVPVVLTIGGVQSNVVTVAVK